MRLVRHSFSYLPDYVTQVFESINGALVRDALAGFVLLLYDNVEFNVGRRVRPLEKVGCVIAQDVQREGNAHWILRIQQRRNEENG